MKSQLTRAFSSPIIQFKFSQHEKYQFNSIGRKNRVPDGWKVSLNTSFPDIKDDDPYITPDVRDSLQSDLTADITEVLSEFNIRNEFTMEMWYNIYHTHQGQEPHTHLGDCTEKSPFWSGIYYNKGTTPTKFYRSDKVHKTQLFPGVDNCTISDTFSECYLPQVEDGDVILFPPYLEHSVYSSSIKMRLTFAMNLFLK